jgi:hypothetical protein
VLCKVVDTLVESVLAITNRIKGMMIYGEAVREEVLQFVRVVHLPERLRKEETLFV